MGSRAKIACLAVVAIAAVGALGSVAAYAAEFHSEIQETFLLGEETNVNGFETSTGVVKCKKVGYVSSGAVVGTGSGSNWHTLHIQLVPSYAECTTFALAATVTVSECHYELSYSSAIAGTTVIGATGSGCTITAHSIPDNCSVATHGQTPATNGISNANQLTGTQRQLSESFGINGISYTVTGPGSACGTLGTHTDGVLHNAAPIIRGYSTSTHTPASQVGIWVE